MVASTPYKFESAEAYSFCVMFVFKIMKKRTGLSHFKKYSKMYFRKKLTEHRILILLKHSYRKTVDFSGIRTRVFRVEGKNADH